MPLVISDSYINYKEAITPLPPALVPGTASSTSASEPPLAKSRPALVDSAILPPSLPIQAESVSAVSGYFSPASEELVSIKDPSLNRFKIRTPNILPNMHHIDRKELYTSLEARIQYLHSFLDFNAGALSSGTPL